MEHWKEAAVLILYPERFEMTIIGNILIFFLIFQLGFANERREEEREEKEILIVLFKTKV